ncbi:MAG: ROK family protein [Patescibacteria group bacterium]|nr:ROK family protein [Patescibacteria group bacterium]MDD4610574.1 ROK family protein [Patescibacteria group bacterium]
MSKQTKTYTIGLDIGGTNMRAGLFDGEKIIADYLLATPKDTLDHFFVMLNALVEPLVEQAKKDKIKISGIGVGIAGVIDLAEKRMLKSPNIPLINGVKIAEKIEEKYNLPVTMDNDTACFLRGEMKMGAGKKFNNAFGVIIGTGIGGSWWVNGEIYQGVFGNAGEIGRMITNFEKPIELEEVYHQLNGKNPIELAERAFHADPLAEKTYQEIGRNLGLAFANIINILNPEAIIIGGGVTGSAELFLPAAKKEMEKYIMNSRARKEVKVLVGKLGNMAGVIGASLLVGKQETNSKIQ